MYSYAIWSMLWCLIPATVVTAPPTTRDSELFQNISKLIYSAHHEVTHLGVLSGNNKQNNRIFFIESDYNEEGGKVDLGLYTLRNSVKTKLLDQAKDIAINVSKTAYFATKDGIYVYNKQRNVAQKYGVVNDDVISLDTHDGTGTLYYLNKQKQLYKVTENGNKSTIVDAVKNAEDIVTDNLGNLVYRSADGMIHVYDGNTVSKVEGIPGDMKKAWFIKCPEYVENYVLLYADDHFYNIFSSNATAQHNGDSTPEGRRLTAMTKAGLFVYYASGKKIYEADIIPKLIEAVFDNFETKIKNGIEEIRKTFM